MLALLEEHGLQVLGVRDLAPNLMAPRGRFGTLGPDEAAEASVEAGRALLASLSPHDVGQAAVVASRRVLAVEGPEGTDRMLARARTLARRPLGLGRPPAGMVLVKRAKDGQDLGSTCRRSARARSSARRRPAASASRSGPATPWCSTGRRRWRSPTASASSSSAAA